MSSLSSGALQKATRKAVAYLFKNNPTLRHQLFTDKALAIILRDECGFVDIDADTVSKAFASGGETKYPMKLKDMGIEYSGDGILFVYKAHRLPDGQYFSAVGWFNSVDEAQVVHPDIRRKLTNIAFNDGEVKAAFQKHLDKNRKKKGKARKTNKRPSSSSSLEKPPPKKLDATTSASDTAPVEQEQEKASEEQPAEVHRPAAPTPELSTNTPLPAATAATATPESNECTVTFSMGSMCGTMTIDVGSAMYKTLSIFCVQDRRVEGVHNVEVREMESEETDQHAPVQQSENGRKPYTITYRDVPLPNGNIIHNVPASHDVVMCNDLSMWRKKANYIDKLKHLFKRDRGKTVIPDQLLDFLATVSLQNSGGSDNGTVTLIAATALVIIRAIGITEDEISTESITKGCPCESTIAQHEYRAAAKLIILKTSQINRSGIKHISLTTDGGERKKMSHMVKVLHYLEVDKDGNPDGIGNFVVDVDTCGKSADEITGGIERSLVPIKKLLSDDIKISGQTGDSGGGGAVQCLFPKLKEKEVLDLYAKYIACMLHAQCKPFEVACKNAFGEQGLGKYTVFQLAYSAITLYRKIIAQGGLALLDKYSEKLHEVLKNSEEWGVEGTNMFRQAMDAHKAKIDDEDYDEIKEFAQSLRNLQLPVMTRWKSVPKALEFLVDNWVPTYFMSVVIIQKEGSKSAMYQIACDIVSMMTLRPDVGESETDADVDIDTSEDDGSIQGSADESTAADAPLLQKGETPILLCQAYFLVGFSKYYFTPWFDSAMQPGPLFGSKSHGHKARLFVQQSYLMKKELDEMMAGDKWKELPEFSDYIASLDGLPSLGDVKKGGLEFMTKAVDLFFKDYKNSSIKHIYTHWTSQMMLVYIIGGDPELAREFIRWLNACRDGALAAGTFEWSQKEIELENHKTYGKAMKSA